MFAFLVVAYVLPLWAFRFVPTEDGPAHLGNAYIIKTYYEAAGSVFRQYYIFNPRVIPNVVYHYALAGLMYVSPPWAAEKVLLSLYVIFFALALRYLAGATGTRAGPGIFLAFPFIYSFPFQMGFFGFAFSLVLACFGLGWFLRCGRASSGRVWLGLNVLAIFTFFWHFLGWAFLIGGILYFAGADGLGRVLGWQPAGGALAARRPARPWLAPAYLAPAIAPAVVYYFKSDHTASLAYRPVGYLVERLFAGGVLNSLHDYQRWEGLAVAVVFGLLLVGAAVTLAARARGGSSAETEGGGGIFVWGWGWAVPITVAAYFLIPDGNPVRGSYASVRLALLPFLVGAMWLAAIDLRWQRRLLYVVAPLVAAAHLVGVFLGFAAADAPLREFTSGLSRVPRNATVLAWTNLRSEPGARVNYVKHAGGYYVVSRNVVDVGNYEPSYSYFPMQWRGRSPLTFAGCYKRIPVFTRASIYAHAEYLVCWKINRNAGGVSEIFARDYRAVFRRGGLSIWRRRPPPLSPP